MPVHTRVPAVIAQTAATMAGLTGGRFVLGLGSSAPVVVHDWNARPHEAPYQRVKDILNLPPRGDDRHPRRHEYATFAVRGFQLKVPVSTSPPVYLAALRPRMLRLAAEHGDGAITNWLGAEDVARVREVVGPELPLVARILVAASVDADAVRAHARRLIAGYLTVPTYARFQEWLGRGQALTPKWERWHAGDGRGARAAIPDEVVDQLVVHGSPNAIRKHVQRYVAAGITVPVLHLLHVPGDLAAAARSLGPTSRSQATAQRGFCLTLRGPIDAEASVAGPGVGREKLAPGAFARQPQRRDTGRGPRRDLTGSVTLPGRPLPDRRALRKGRPRGRAPGSR
jgi:probable F420-dependent oxidoreductase